MPEHIYLIGASGSGKSTLAARMAAQHGLILVSVRTCVQQVATEESGIGHAVRAHLALPWSPLPDTLMCAVILPCLDNQRALVVDGFPRTVGQAQALDAWLVECPMVQPRWWHLKCSDAVLLHRRAARQRHNEDSEERMRVDRERLPPLLAYLEGRLEVMQ